MTNKTEWAYCPECGCEDVRHEEGEHKQCASCHQEWFSSVDYSDVVRKHLSGKYIDKDAEIERLRDEVDVMRRGSDAALRKCNDLRAELGECKGEHDRAVNKVDALRDQSAEREALLLRCMQAFNHVVGFSDQNTRTAWYENFLKPVSGAVMVHLSASAEPANKECE